MMSTRRGLGHFLRVDEARYIASAHHLDGDNRVGVAIVHSCTQSACEDAVRYFSPQCARVVLVVPSAPSARVESNVVAAARRRAVHVEFFCSDALKYRCWDAARTPPCRIAARTEITVCGPYPSIFEGDPQCRALGARVGDFVAFERVASDGVTLETHYCQVVRGDARFFDALGKTGKGVASAVKETRDDDDDDEEEERDEYYDDGDDDDDST